MPAQSESTIIQGLSAGVSTGRRQGLRVVQVAASPMPSPPSMTVHPGGRPFWKAEA